jgi:hypothetical protein
MKKIIPQDHFIRITASNGERVTLSPTHGTTVIRDGEEQAARAALLTVADFLITRDGHAAITSIEHVEEPSHKVSITCIPDHEFYCSESESVSILVHNQQLPS